MIGKKSREGMLHLGCRRGWLKNSLQVEDQELIDFVIDHFEVWPLVISKIQIMEDSEFAHEDYDQMVTLLEEPVIFYREGASIKLSRHYDWEGIGHEARDSINIEVKSIDPETCHKFVQAFTDKWLVPPQKKDRRKRYRKRRRGKIHMLLPTSGGMQFFPVGDVGWRFEADNYTPEQIKAFHSIAENLTTETPQGALHILSGKPGTGKTYLIRGLIEKCRECMFVVVSPSMVPHIADPEMLQAFLRQKIQKKWDGPLVLIIEDADHCLVPRAHDNMSSISSLLNLADGLLEEIIDIRILATTNAQLPKMDEAITRDMRKHSLVEFKVLDAAHAEALYRKLTGKDIPPEIARKQHTLASLYKEAWPEFRKRQDIELEKLLQKAKEENSVDYDSIETIRAKIQAYRQHREEGADSRRDKFRKARRLGGYDEMVEGVDMLMEEEDSPRNPIVKQRRKLSW
jgi:hypothetical protein